MNLKETFNIDTLLDIYEYIRTEFEECETETFATRLGVKSDFADSVHKYAHILETTKLEPWMFKGPKAIFEGFKIGQSSDPIVQHVYYIEGSCKISFYRPYVFEGKETVKVEAYTIKENGWDIDQSGFIKTLADFADLTKSNIPLK